VQGGKRFWEALDRLHRDTGFAEIQLLEARPGSEVIKALGGSTATIGMPLNVAL
jgi:hypothetical protein